eukprot:TRINITY_DN107069_c0_g1_i1.p1 TRINITY_DN107069_c0_g1~~TRINITY_DN107069_c0_g1_i1.p1  ORF type:complete len:914 (-),score=148.65 TRINITY_DN107069_c0_g1_i1:269-3010(-)
MGKQSKAEYDINLSRNPDVLPEQLASELGHALRLKGYCTIKLGTGKEILLEASSEAMGLQRAGHLQLPPEQLMESLLGPEGTSGFCRFDDVQVGPSLASLRAHLRRIAETSLSVSSLDAKDAPCITEDYLIQGGDCPDDVELSCEDCSAWINNLSRAKMLFIYFFGKGTGYLELKPFADDDLEVVDIGTESDMLVILQADISSHKHVSTRGMFAIFSWALESGSSAIRGWSGGISKIFGSVAPAAKVLQEWSHERVQELVEMAAEEKLEEPIPLDWQRMLNHSYITADQIPVSVRGEAGHHPGTNITRGFWGALNCGGDFVTDVPFARWGHDEFYSSDPGCWMESQLFIEGSGIKAIKTSVRHAQFIEGVDLFDNKFFGLSPNEAKGMEPMQRHILETSYEALFQAGYKKSSLMRAYIAVFTGCTHPEAAYMEWASGVAGMSQAITSNRTSFLLGLMGPSTSVDCDLSSSAMALMMGNSAVSNKNLHRNKTGGTSVAAVCGGVYIALNPFMWPRWNAFMNPAGRCFSFAQNADGWVVGEACISVALKPYAEKIDDQLIVADGPRVGNIVGLAATNNGKSAGLCAPAGPAEQEAIAESVRSARISALDLDALECHCVGSLLADSVEVSSAATVLRCMAGGERETLILNSCKTNTGVQREACSMSAFLKVLFNIMYANNAPVIHLKQLNPYFEVGNAAVSINAESIAYRDSSVFHGIGSRGMGGTNINIVCQGSADASVVPFEGPKMYRQSFAYWPGGGGQLEDEDAPTDGYFLIGSWSDWLKPEKLVCTKEGVFAKTVTLGTNCFESFQVCLDGDRQKILHPDRANAPSGSKMLGPSPPDVIQRYHLTWTIDGRVSPAPSSLDVSFGAQHLQRPKRANATHARDAGWPGDQYEVKLLVKGKYRAITWEKVRAPS